MLLFIELIFGKALKKLTIEGKNLLRITFINVIIKKETPFLYSLLQYLIPFCPVSSLPSNFLSNRTYSFVWFLILEGD